MNSESDAKPQKMKFKPKIPPKKAPKVVVAKEEPSLTNEDVLSKELLEKINRAKLGDGFARKFGQTDRKAAGSSEVAFGRVSSTVARSFPRRAKQDQSSAPEMEKKYTEPWDYAHSYYPVTLPLRRPYSGDPEILDEEEFGEASTSVPDEMKINAVEELGLMDGREEPHLMFFQFPTNLPFKKPLEEAVESKSNAKKDPLPFKGCKLEELPAGLMGKLLVYKSGKIKMKIGDALYDVSPGSKCTFAQDIAVVNTKERVFCNLGAITTRAVVTPDVDSLLDALEED